MSKRNLDLGNGAAVPAASVPQRQRPVTPPTSPVVHVDLSGGNQLIVYTTHLSRLICPACKAHGVMTSRVNPVTTLFVCQECLAQFEVEWHPQMTGVTIQVDQFTMCPDCYGKGDVVDGELVQTYCARCSGYGRVRLPRAPLPVRI